MQRCSRPNIAFAGLTAAGKTTHAKILAQQLGYEWISATAIILDILGSRINPAHINPEKVWFTHYKQIEKAREDDAIDIELERRVRAMARNREGLIFDTWAMAYIYEGPLIRLWIESDEASRMRKCYVSQEPTKPFDLVACRNLIHEKDTSVREKFARRLRFDLFTDMSRYDAVLENTDLIPEPTEQCSRIGIRTFAPVVSDVVHYLIQQALDTPTKESIQSLQAKYGTMVQKINKHPWSFPEPISVSGWEEEHRIQR